MMKEYGISRPTVISVLKNQFWILEVFDTLYAFSCTAYLVTPLDLVTFF